VIENLAELKSLGTIDADVCLIGGGAAGITIARQLEGSALRVCLVEGGSLKYETESQELFDGQNVGQPIALEGGRLRFLGGTTNHWGGRCAMLDAADFRARDWLPHSGWPLDRAELEPYYARARAVAGFTQEWQSDAQTLALLKVAPPDLNADLIRPYLWHYAPATKDAGVWNWRIAYRKVLEDAPNVRVLLNANFQSFTTDGPGRRVQALAVRSRNGVGATITARRFVLCSGGIENARLLLLGAADRPGAFGNAHDLVGRYFMQHSRGPAGLLVSAERLSRLQEQFNVLLGPDGLEYEVGLTLAPAVQAQQGLLNCSAVLQYQGDPESGVATAQEIWRGLLGGHWPPQMGEKVWRVASDLGAFARSVEQRLASGHSLAADGAQGVPSRSAVILVDLEQAPDPQSRISLADERDALGLRRVRTDWRLGERERRTAAAFMGLIASEFARLGIGRCRLEPWLQDGGPPMGDALGETYHYIGATRMAEDPREGVVDRNGAVHGMDNLFVAGSSVFPTGGHTNPTLTIVALALRLADHLSK
jgi:choline dehydrogenase-like flavoprotein